jgi:hypothetical protein
MAQSRQVRVGAFAALCFLVQAQERQELPLAVSGMSLEEKIDLVQGIAAEVKGAAPGVQKPGEGQQYAGCWYGYWRNC